MSPLESLLRDALRRQDPPEGFAERVLQRARQAPRRHRPPRWLMAASLLGLLLPGAWSYHLHQARQRAEAARAQAQLRLALQITHQKLDLAFRHLQTDPE